MPDQAKITHALDDETLIDVSCPKCRQPFSVREQFAGSDVPCPVCNTLLAIAPLHGDEPLDESAEDVLKELAEDAVSAPPPKKSQDARAARSPRPRRGRELRARPAGTSFVAPAAIAGMVLVACALIWKMTSRDEASSRMASIPAADEKKSANDSPPLDAPGKQLAQDSRAVPVATPPSNEIPRAEIPAALEKPVANSAKPAAEPIPAAPETPAPANASAPEKPVLNDPGFPERRAAKTPDDVDDRDVAVMNKKLNGANDGEAGPLNPFKRDEPKAAAAGKASKPAEPAMLAAALPAACPQCGGTRFLPILPGKAYVWMGGEAANAAQSVPWKWCSRCQKNADANELLQQETARLANHTARHQELLQGAHLDLVQAETPSVTLHAQMPAAQTRAVAQALEELRMHLQRVSGTTVLTPTRADTHEIIILKDGGSYNAYMDLLAATNPGTDFSLARKCSGSSGRNSSFYNASLGVPHVPPPEHMALFMLGQMFMREATDGKAPAWLVEGFAAYGENVVTKKNLCYSFAYELNEVKFGMNWNADIKKFAKDGKLKPWKQVFPLELVGMKSLDYLTCYSVVCFLMNDPHRFVNFVNEIRAGSNSDAALEKAYGQKFEALQSAWALWTQR